MRVLNRIFLALALLALVGTGAQAQSSNYVSLWKGEGNVEDSVGSNHGIWTSDGRPITEGYALGPVGDAFNIVWPTWIEVPHDPSLNASGSVTISFWFRTDRVHSSTLVVKSGSWSFHLNGTNNGCGFNNPRDRSYPNYLRCIGSLAFNVSGTNGNAGVNTSSFIGRHNYTDGQWHHVVGMFDAATGRVSVYMDGGHIGTSTQAISAIKSSATPLQIGGLPAAFIGDIDEVAIHLRTLSPEEISTLAAGGSLEPSNAAPVADAGADQAITCAPAVGADVVLDGSASSDADGDALSYSWRSGGFEIATGSNPTVSLAPGVHTIDLVVNDGAEDSAADQVVIAIVEDVTAPVVTLNGAAELTLECSLGSYDELGAAAIDECDGALAVSISGSVDISTVGEYVLTYTATDAAGNSASVSRTVSVVDTTPPVVALNGDAAVTLEAKVDSYEEAGASAVDACDGEVAVVVTGSVDADAVGEYVLTYEATDAAGNSASVSRTVSVVDTAPPVIVSTVISTSLWPPNHSMHLILSGISAADINDGALAPVIVVSSDEAANGNGDGNTDVDFEIVESGDGSYDVYVRAERNGKNDGRTYTVTVDVSDAAGNAAEQQVFTAEVAKSQGKGKGKNAKLAVVPESYGLNAAMPNPFNPSTLIAYQLPTAGEVSLIVYNAVGQQVRVLEQGYRASGVYRIEWDGRDDSGVAVASGLYLYRFVSAGFAETKSMTLLK